VSCNSKIERASGREAGDVIVLANAVGTFAFVVTALTAAIVFSTPAQWVGAVTAMGLFAVGVFAFIWSFFNAVQRSREEEMSVLQIYLLVGKPTPSRVRWIMLTLLLTQCVVAMATALARPDGPDGSPGSSLAVGILVPMFGIGLNGLWCAFHGVFDLREAPTSSPREVDENGAESNSALVVAPQTPSIDKNENHG
jgi:hypothetical protein